MEKKTNQTGETYNTDNIDVIASLIYKAISNKMISEQNKERALE